MIIQLVGYLASVFLAVSLVVSNDLKFRWINFSGCLTFSIYGVLIQSFPVIITNILLAVINAIYLYKLYKAEEVFEILDFNNQSVLINRFVQHYNKDIRDYFPQFDEDNSRYNVKFVVLRDLAIANIFIAEKDNEGNAVVNLNYTLEKYRDYKIGKFLFNKNNQHLKELGVKKITYNKAINKKHQAFLRKMGFKEENGKFTITV